MPGHRGALSIYSPIHLLPCDLLQGCLWEMLQKLSCAGQQTFQCFGYNPHAFPFPPFFLEFMTQDSPVVTPAATLYDRKNAYYALQLTPLSALISMKHNMKGSVTICQMDEKEFAVPVICGVGPLNESTHIQHLRQRQPQHTKTKPLST